MSYTKREFIEDALDEIGLGTYVFDSSPEKLQSALRKLDRMMAKWNGEGIRIGYPIPSSPSLSDLDTDCIVPDFSWQAIITNLSIILAPSFGKVISLETKKSAQSSYDALLSRTSSQQLMQFPGTLPAGSGNRPWYWNQDPYVNAPVDYIEVGPDGILELNN